MANAGVAAFCSGAVSSFARTGDLVAVVKEVCSTDNLKAIGISMASAGLCSEICGALKLDMNPSLKAAIEPSYTPGLTDFLKVNAIRAAVNVPLNVVIGGEKIGDAVVDGVKGMVIDTAGQYAAHQIGQAYRGKAPETATKSTGNQSTSQTAQPQVLEAPKIDYITHKVLHALTGGVTGWALSPDQKGFISGAIGAFTSEVVMDARQEIAAEKAVGIIQKAKQEGRPLDSLEFQRQLQEGLWVELGLSKISGASLAGVLGQDPCIAAHTATNAVENNAIMAAIGVGLAVWEVYELYQTYENEGAIAVLQKIAIDGVIVVAGMGAFKVAELSAPMAAKVWQAYIAANPAFAQVLNKVFAPIGQGFSKTKDIYHRVDDALDTAWDKGKQKLGLGKGKTTGLQQLQHSKTFECDMLNNPGPLAMMKNTPAANFAGGKYNIITLKEDVVLYRAGSSKRGYEGEWFSTKVPLSEAQVRIDHAVKPHWLSKTGVHQGSSPIDCYYSVQVPKGATVYQGPVANQGGVYVGGTGPDQTQIFIPYGTEGLKSLGYELLKK